MNLQPGQIVRVRSRKYLVEGVIPPPEPVDSPLVRLSCVEDDALGEPLEVLRDQDLPYCVYANAGHGEECSPADLVAHARIWLAAGAGLVGGCCGTTPEHLRALAILLASPR